MYTVDYFAWLLWRVLSRWVSEEVEQQSTAGSNNDDDANVEDLDNQRKSL